MFVDNYSAIAGYRTVSRISKTWRTSVWMTSH